MTTLLLKAALALSMIFGSVGGTAVLATDSLPDSLLYPLKLTIEETRLAMTGEPADRAALLLAFAQERAQEIEELALAGEIPDEAALQRLQLHLEQMLHLAAQLPDETMMHLLTQAQEMVHTQEQALVAAQANVAGPAQDALQQANGMPAQVRETIAAGLQDPQTFRWQHGNMPEGIPQENGPCNIGDCEPAGDENYHGHGGG